MFAEVLEGELAFARGHASAKRQAADVEKTSASQPVSRALSRTVIYLGARLLWRSSSLPGSHDGSDQSCFPIWPCSRWGLPSQPVTRLLVGSYPTISPLPNSRQRAGRSPHQAAGRGRPAAPNNEF